MPAAKATPEKAKQKTLREHLASNGRALEDRATLRDVVELLEHAGVVEPVKPKQPKKSAD